MDGYYYPDLVKTFYPNIKLKKGVIHSKINRVKIVIDGTIWKDFFFLFRIDGIKITRGDKKN